MKLTDEERALLRRAGSEGGKAGKGAAKRRAPEHYARAGRARWAKARAAKAAKRAQREDGGE
jgi:hypothetical protein